MGLLYLSWEELPPALCCQGALAIGNFDGVHRGHAALVAELRRQADLVKGPAVALTFDPHPLELLRPESFQPLLTCVSDRAQLIQQAGADHVAVLKTTPYLLQQTATEFFVHVVRSRFQARALVEGENFRFGHNREGDVESLRALCRQAGIQFSVVSPYCQEGAAVSSSRVRSALVQGDVRQAASLLGRSYRLRGVVGTGQRRGKTLGFPTANLQQMTTLVPANGVYAVRAFHRGTAWPGAANIGPNPTFGEQVRKVEVHLIGFDGDLYGEELAVDFLDRLRDTRPFADVAQLTDQLRRDIDQAKRLVETSEAMK